MQNNTLTPEEIKTAKEAEKAAAVEAKAAAKAAKEAKNPDFVNMINPKGVEVEIHKNRVDELSKQGYKLA